MSNLTNYHDWKHAHSQAVYRRDHDAATLARIEYATVNDRLNRGNAKHLCELIDDMRKLVAEDADRVTHILEMRPTATESASKLKLEAAAPDLLAALFGLLNTCELNAPEMEIETQEAINAAVIAIVKAKGAQL